MVSFFHSLLKYIALWMRREPPNELSDFYSFWSIERIRKFLERSLCWHSTYSILVISAYQSKMWISEYIQEQKKFLMSNEDVFNVNKIVYGGGALTKWRFMPIFTVFTGWEFLILTLSCQWNYVIDCWLIRMSECLWNMQWRKYKSVKKNRMADAINCYDVMIFKMSVIELIFVKNIRKQNLLSAFKRKAPNETMKIPFQIKFLTNLC